MQTISRSEAKALGLARYFTGRLCRRGHISDRAVADGKCRLCGREYVKKYAATNVDAVRERNLAWRSENIERVREMNLAAKERNRERNLARGRAYNKENAEKRNAYAKKYYSANRDRIKSKKLDLYYSTSDHESGCYRLPSLDEACHILLGEEPRAGIPSAWDDLERTRSLFFWLRTRGAFDLEAAA